MLGRSPRPQQPFRDGADERPSLTPLILFAASPDTITGVITLAIAHAKLLLPVTVLVAVAVLECGSLWCFCPAGDRVQVVGFSTIRGRNLWD
jgi:hypothetical protein